MKMLSASSASRCDEMELMRDRRSPLLGHRSRLLSAEGKPGKRERPSGCAWLLMAGTSAPVLVDTPCARPRFADRTRHGGGLVDDDRGIGRGCKRRAAAALVLGRAGPRDDRGRRR